MAKVRLNGDSSGFIELAAPNAAGSNTLTLPTSNGSANQLLKNSGTAGALAWSTLTEDSSGNLNVDSGTLFVDATNNRVGIGTTTPGTALDVSGAISLSNVALPSAGTARIFSRNTDSNLYIQTGSGSTINLLDASQNTMALFEPTNVRFFISNSEKARLDSSGRLLLGTSSTSSTDNNANFPNFQLEGGVGDPSRLLVRCNGGTTSTNGPVLYLARSRGTTANSKTAVAADDLLGTIIFEGTDGTHDRRAAAISAFADAGVSTDDMPGRLVFATSPDGTSNPTERMRIQQNGNVLIGKTDATETVNGVGFTSQTIHVSSQGQASLRVNRNGDDGALITFSQDGTQEGTISVSGTTVTLNGAHLSRWSQIPGIDPHDKTVRPEILRGTVMSNLDEMCDWIDPDSGDAQANEQLNKTKISDVEGDKNVAGVFQSWDDDDDTRVNDYYLAMTGDFVIRIAAGVTVERGDLLMSAGDGTAKPQDDDIIRSKTIAKVTSTNVSCTYDDGSYCVPCVLMAC